MIKELFEMFVFGFKAIVLGFYRSTKQDYIDFVNWLIKYD